MICHSFWEILTRSLVSLKKLRNYSPFSPERMILLFLIIPWRFWTIFIFCSNFLTGSRLGAWAFSASASASTPVCLSFAASSLTYAFSFSASLEALVSAIFVSWYALASARILSASFLERASAYALLASA